MKVDLLLVSILAAVHVHILDATAAQGTFCWKEGSLQYFDSPAFVLLAQHCNQPGLVEPQDESQTGS